MEKQNQLRTLLVEILIVVLFFALAATTLLEVFVGARSQSVRAGITNEALFDAQNLADKLYSTQDAEALLAGEGFSREQDAWRLQRGAYDLTVTLQEERLPGGVLCSARVCAQYEGQTLLTLPSARYMPEEVTP